MWIQIPYDALTCCAGLPTLGDTKADGNSDTRCLALRSASLQYTHVYNLYNYTCIHVPQFFEVWMSQCFLSCNSVKYHIIYMYMCMSCMLAYLSAGSYMQSFVMRSIECREPFFNRVLIPVTGL